MSKIIQSVVDDVIVKTGTTKKGAYYKNVRFEVEGQLYGGFVDKDNKAVVDSISAGDTIMLRVKQNGQYWNWDKVKLIEKGTKKPSETTGAVREYAMSVGKATGLVQALIAAGALGKKPTSAKVLATVASYAAGIHDLVVAGPDQDSTESEPEDTSSEPDPFDDDASDDSGEAAWDED